jgi:hypothetical protein
MNRLVPFISLRCQTCFPHLRPERCHCVNVVPIQNLSSILQSSNQLNDIISLVLGRL